MITPDALRIGDRIIVKRNPHTGAIVRTTIVKEVAECPGKWRTHIHVNGHECYDTRVPIDVIGTD